jgi:hypothetical protein
MASEISGLPALRGYLKVGNLVVRLSFPFIDLPRRAVALMERPAPRSGTPGPSAESAGSGVTTPGARTSPPEGRASQRRGVDHALEYVP